MNMLQNCPEDTRKVIAVEMAKMVVEQIKKDEEEDDDDFEERLDAEQ